MYRWVTNLIAQVLLFYLLSLSNLYAQELSYRQFTMEDGLPSNQIYDICRDKTGYVWFGTENGLSRFDGASFKNFTIHDGLPDTEILGMYEDSKNRIWLRTLNGKIGFIRNGIFNNYQNTPFLDGQILDDFITHIVEDKAGNLYIISDQSFLHLSPDNTFVKHDFSFLNLMQAKTKSGDVFIFTPLSLLDSIIYRLPDLTETKYEKNLFSPAQQQQFKIPVYGNVYLRVKEILQIKESEWNAFQENISTRFIEYNGDKWLYGVTTPLQKLIFKNDKLHIESWGDDLLMNCAMVDQSHNFWLGSPDKGAFLIGAFNSYNYKTGSHLKGGNLTSFYLDKKDKRIYTGSVDGWINSISEDRIWGKRFETNSTLAYPRIRSIKKSRKGELWILSDREIKKLNRETLSPIPNSTFSPYGAPKFISFPDHTFNGYLTTARSTYSFSYSQDAEVTMGLNLFDNRSTCHYFDKKKDRLWIGTPSGLFYSDGGMPANSTIELLSNDPISFINMVDSTLIVGTNGKGIVLFKGDQIQRLNVADGLASNLIRSIYIHEDQNIWIATNNGLSLLKTTDLDSLHFFTLNKDNGLISNEVLDCTVLDSSLYVLSSQGVTVINLTNIEHKQGIPIINIEKALINNVEIDKDSIASFKHHQNNLHIYFSCIYFGNRSDLEFIYQLKGYHQNWKRTRNTDLYFEKLPPGKYELSIHASINNEMGLNPSIFTFEIAPAFYQRKWVRFFAFILFVLAIAYLIHLLFERQKKKSKIENRLLQLEQVALQSQMNPHFIKNALGAIQHLMITKDVRTANKYLITFGELITQFMRQADQSIIKVNDEIEVLNLYLSIEKLRFDNNFKYTIDGTSEDLLECNIPSMMIQPLVENAIIHGFRDVSRDKMNQLDISLKADGKDYIICTVSDNGLGMLDRNKERALIKKKGIALKNIKERVYLLSAQFSKTSFEILRSDSQGTSIQLCLPVKNKMDK